MRQSYFVIIYLFYLTTSFQQNILHNFENSPHVVGIYYSINNQFIQFEMDVNNLQSIAIIYGNKFKRQAFLLVMNNQKVNVYEVRIDNDQLKTDNISKNNLKIIYFKKYQKASFSIKFRKYIITNDSLIYSQKKQLQFSYIINPFIQKSNRNVSISSQRLLIQLSKDTPYFETNLRKNIILTICWCLLADFGIIMKYSYHYSFHIGLFMIASFLSAYQLLQLIFAGIPNINIIQISIYYWLGFFIIILNFFQMILGILLRIFLNRKNSYPGLISNLILSHKILGYFTIASCKAQVMFGWYLSSQILIMIGVGIYITFELVLLAFFKYVYSRTFSQFHYCQEQKVNLLIQPDITQNFANLMRKPYNSQQLDQYNFFIFRDYVYLFDSFQFHPGGSKIIQLINHRQVDRFMYGMYHIENFPELNRYNHPINSLKLLKPPIYKLPRNPIYKFTSQKFVVQQCISITSQLSVFTFRQAQGQLQFNQPNNLLNFGQYFTFKGFGLIRLYTCVRSQSKKQRQKNKYILQLLNFVFQHQTLPTIIFTDNYSTEHSTSINMTHKKLNLNESITTDQNFNNIQCNQKNTISCVIKKYKNTEGFSYLLHENYKNCKLSITGLFGRGLCLSQLPKGVIVLLAGGAIFPFLDLLDVIFKILANKRIIIPQDVQKQVNIYKKLLSRFRFLLYGSFKCYRQIIIPQQLSFMQSCNDPFFKMHIKLSKPNMHFQKSAFKRRFDKQFMKNQIKPIIDEISMIYVCGPPGMCKNIIEGGNEYGVPSNKIFMI